MLFNSLVMFRYSIGPFLWYELCDTLKKIRNEWTWILQKSLKNLTQEEHIQCHLFKKWVSTFSDTNCTRIKIKIYKQNLKL